MQLIGINAWLHDSAACLIRDGKVIAAIEEERWTRDDKHTGAFPQKSLRFCLKHAEGPIDHVAINLDPSLSGGPKSGLASALSKDARRARKHLRSSVKRAWRQTRQELRGAGALSSATAFHEVGHHDAHAASTFLVSPFEDAAVLTLDGRGEWATTCRYHGTGNRLRSLGALGLPESLGLFYAAFTEHLGFRRNNDEYKVMGLASYGDPARFAPALEQLIRPTPQGFEIAAERFAGADAQLTGIGSLTAALGLDPRVPESTLEQVHKDLAASLQARVEEIGLHLARTVKTETGSKNLCLAGGVALNCVMNTRILKEVPFEGLYVQPAAYDAGGALGAPLWVYHQLLKQPRSQVMSRVDLGPEFSDEEIEPILSAGLLKYRRVEDPAEAAAELIAAGKIVGWFQGRGEFGPRALGHRSILADPCRPEMQDHVNNRVKHREDFRPFAPSARVEDFQTYFDSAYEDPFMTTVIPVREAFRERMPAITHVDGTARLQTVHAEANPLYHRLIGAVGERTGIPVVLNTSFNVRGEPMVCTPKDAIRCFFTTGLDHLVMGSFVLDKWES